MESLNKKQYLDSNFILGKLKIYDFPPTDLISADTYNEEMILENFLKFPEDDQILLMKCAIHVAVIGYGNKTYGKIRDSSGSVIDIITVFRRLGILFNKNINEKYDSEFISARRLIRLLRYHIRTFIEKTGRPSYLWFKYSDKNEQKMNICFPGGEHLVETQEDAIYLLDTYSNLDSRQNTKFVERLTRVFIARSILPPQFFLHNVRQQIGEQSKTIAMPQTVTIKQPQSYTKFIGSTMTTSTTTTTSTTSTSG